MSVTVNKGTIRRRVRIVVNGAMKDGWRYKQTKVAVISVIVVDLPKEMALNQLSG